MRFSPWDMSSLFWLVIAALVVGSKGLELKLDLNPRGASADRTICGVLICSESFRAPNATQSDSDAIDLVGQENVTISSLKVFRVETGTDNGSSRRRRIASVTSQESRLTRVSNGITIQGRLETRWATLRLELAKQNDCQAEYICESHAVSAQGNKHLSSSHILQQSEQSSDQGSDVSWTPQVAMRVLTLLQQLDTKFEFLSRSVEKLEQDINTESNRLEDRILSQSDRLEDRILSQSDDLEDKISAVKSSFVTLEAKIHTNMGGTCKKLDQKLKSWEENEELIFRNLALNVQNITRKSSDRLSVAVSESIATLENSLQNSLENISSDINVSAIGTQALLRQSALQANPTFPKDTVSALIGLLTPKNCYRGMVSLLASTPYIVIRPGQNNTLDFPVLCDTFTDGGGWIVVQRRITGDVDFNQGWEDYKNGFGSVYGDFWLGNEKLHSLTSSGTFELRVDMRYGGNIAFAHYDTFSVGNEASHYRLQVGHYGGTAGNSLTGHHNGRSFSTRDRDNDQWSGSCAARYSSGWWFGACHHANLNGRWGAGANMGPRWKLLSVDNPLSYTEMKIRRVV